MRALITIILCSATAAVTGYARFWGAGQPGVWVDLLFLASTAIVVTVIVAVVMRRMRRLGGVHHPDDTTRDHS